jgi:adenosylhomocysteine nucleosidase
MAAAVHDGAGERRVTGVLCALPEELGALRGAAGGARRRQGLELLELDLGAAGLLLACVAGIGKVRAARAATLLLAEGAGRLLVVGTCGGLRRHLGPGALVHCERAAQADLAVREGRELVADASLAAAWAEVAPGSRAWFLTADRPVMSAWRRRRLTRAFPGDCVADMETAAAAAVAAAAGVPWAALRAVTDRAGALTPASFRAHFPVQAGRAADTVPALLERLVSLPREGESR